MDVKSLNLQKPTKTKIWVIKMCKKNIFTYKNQDTNKFNCPILKYNYEIYSYQSKKH